jgi:hypothetical protein
LNCLSQTGNAAALSARANLITSRYMTAALRAAPTHPGFSSPNDPSSARPSPFFGTHSHLHYRSLH